jgi:ribose transport system permease protein
MGEARDKQPTNIIKGIFARLSRSQKQFLSTLSGLLLLMLVFFILSPHFLTVSNILTVATQTAVIAIIAIGQTYVLITGGIDLSIGSNIALSAMVAGICMRANMPVSFAIMAGLLTGMVSGVMNGIMVAFGKLPPFIATLGMMTVARGLSYTLTRALPIANLPQSFTVFGTGRTLGIPNPVIIMVVLSVIFGFILAKTKLGRHVYAIGSNFEAARLSGVNTKMVQMWVYIFSGLLAAFAGLIMAARIITAQPASGDGYELDAVASSVIGGASTMGGEGTIAGTFIGAFVIGIVIVASVFLDKIKKKD